MIDTINKNKNTRRFQEFDLARFKSDEHRVWMERVTGRQPPLQRSALHNEVRFPGMPGLNESPDPVMSHASESSIRRSPTHKRLSMNPSRTSLPENEEEMVAELMNELGEVTAEEQEMYDQALSELDQLGFDSFQCQQIFGDKVFMVVSFVIFAKYP